MDGLNGDWAAIGEVAGVDVMVSLVSERKKSKKNEEIYVYTRVFKEESERTNVR